jgi:hypothetical protein
LSANYEYEESLLEDTLHAKANYISTEVGLLICLYHAGGKFCMNFRVGRHSAELEM